jgi:hypothetical protein
MRSPATRSAARPSSKHRLAYLGLTVQQGGQAEIGEGVSFPRFSLSPEMRDTNGTLFHFDLMGRIMLGCAGAAIWGAVLVSLGGVRGPGWSGGSPG